MEGEIKLDESSVQSENRDRKSGASLVSNASTTKKIYEDEVLVSQPSLSCKTTLVPNTLELR